MLGTWGESQRRYHRSAGRPEQTITSIGWPRLAGRGPAPDGDAQFDILYFGQPVPSLSAGNWPEDMVNAAHMVGLFADRHPERRVAWKPHPASGAYGGAYEPGPRVIEVTGDSLDLIARARIVAVATSTTALEAMTLGRPVIQLVSRGHTGGPDFVAELGAATPVMTLEELEEVAGSLLGDPIARQHAVEAGRAYVSTFISGFRVPGEAEGRLLDVVTRLVDAPK